MKNETISTLQQLIKTATSYMEVAPEHRSDEVALRAAAICLMRISQDYETLYEQGHPPPCDTVKAILYEIKHQCLALYKADSTAEGSLERQQAIHQARLSIQRLYDHTASMINDLALSPEVKAQLYPKPETTPSYRLN